MKFARALGPRSRALYAVLSVASFLAVAPLPAAAQALVTLRLTGNAPPKSPWAVQIERFAARVAEESKGTVKIESFLGGQLGNEQDTIQQVARGRIDMGFFALGAASLLVPELQLAIMPAYFRTEGLTRVAPAFSGKPILSAEQVEDVVAFLKTLRD